MDYIPIFVVQYCTIVSNAEVPSYVWSQDIRLIDQFIKQHNFDESYIRKFIINSEDVEGHTDCIQPDNELKVFQLISNVDNKMHPVVTTDEIVDSTVQILGDDLVDNLTFGDIITRTDVKVIDRITTLIDQLDYASIADWELIADNIVDKYYDEDYFYYGNRINEHPEIPPPADTSSIYDSLWSDRINKEYPPFTLEAYVHYFVKDVLGG